MDTELIKEKLRDFAEVVKGRPGVFVAGFALGFVIAWLF